MYRTINNLLFGSSQIGKYTWMHCLNTTTSSTYCSTSGEDPSKFACPARGRTSQLPLHHDSSSLLSYPGTTSTAKLSFFIEDLTTFSRLHVNQLISVLGDLFTAFTSKARSVCIFLVFPFTDGVVRHAFQSCQSEMIQLSGNLLFFQNGSNSLHICCTTTKRAN